MAPKLRVEQMLKSLEANLGKKSLVGGNVSNSVSVKNYSFNKMCPIEPKIWKQEYGVMHLDWLGSLKIIDSY